MGAHVPRAGEAALQAACDGFDSHGLHWIEPLAASQDLFGLLVEWEDADFARRKSGFNSPAVHCTGLWSNGTTPAWRAGDPGSIPGGSTETEATASGYATLVANQGGGRSPVLRVRLSPLPLETPMVKRISRLASNEGFRVQLLVGVLNQAAYGFARYTEGPPDWRRGPVGSRWSFLGALRVRLPLLPLRTMVRVV